MAGVVFKSSDLLADLERIVKLHTRHYQEDFELDKKLLAELCASATPEDHHVIWMSRVNGTHCLREREIFLADSYENHVWHFYHEQLHDSVLAYALTLNGVENGKIKADIFPLDYPAYAERTKALTCSVECMTAAFEDGTQQTFPYRERRSQIAALASAHGAVQCMTLHPESERELAMILRRERLARERNAKVSDIDDHFAQLEKKPVRSKLKVERYAKPPAKKKVVPER